MHRNLSRRSVAVAFVIAVGLQVVVVPIARAGDPQSSCVAPPAGLVSWWPGDEDARDIVGPNDGQLFGGAEFGPGVVGQAFKFNGIDGYFQSTSLNLPVGHGDRTIEFVGETRFGSPTGRALRHLL